MHLFLIRHGETEHNIVGLLAGVTDSRLTNHGHLQAQRLGQHLAATRNLRLTHAFASDLQRAWMTAEALRTGQESHFKNDMVPLDIVKLELLREQDFGSLELTPWTTRQAFDAPDHRNAADFKHKETTEAMKTRAEQFLDDCIAPLWALDDAESYRVAVVSHGLFLATLWRTLLGRFDISNIFLGPDVGPLSPDKPLEYTAAWSNTGFLEAEVRGPEDSRPQSNLSLRVIAINSRDHLLDLKRARGGLGSAAHDTRQKQIDGFFKRPKLDEEAEAPADP